jgi:probable rRNA maturation factor
VGTGELGLVFVGPEESRALKREHLGVDEATDALAFPIDGLAAVPDGVPRQLGDVVVCPDMVGQEWRRPLVHALLHLVGYDHGPAMEAREAVHAS